MQQLSHILTYAQLVCEIPKGMDWKAIIISYHDSDYLLGVTRKLLKQSSSIGHTEPNYPDHVQDTEEHRPKCKFVWFIPTYASTPARGGSLTLERGKCNVEWSNNTEIPTSTSPPPYHFPILAHLWLLPLISSLTYGSTRGARHLHT